MRKTISVSVALDHSMLAELDNLARSNGRTRSGMVRRLIQMALIPMTLDVTTKSKGGK